MQLSHFIEGKGAEPMKRVTFYGHEKNETTAKPIRSEIELRASGR